MDINGIIAVVGSFILGIGAVAAFLHKYLPRVAKYITIAKEAIDVADKAIEALKDDQVTPDEINGIMAELAALKAAFKA